jgi:hypothetical protein
VLLILPTRYSQNGRFSSAVPVGSSLGSTVGVGVGVDVVFVDVGVGIGEDGTQPTSAIVAAAASATSAILLLDDMVPLQRPVRVRPCAGEKSRTSPPDDPRHSP